jgi:hypothetical protein
MAWLPASAVTSTCKNRYAQVDMLFVVLPVLLFDAQAAAGANCQFTCRHTGAAAAVWRAPDSSPAP